MFPPPHSMDMLASGTFNKTIREKTKALLGNRPQHRKLEAQCFFRNTHQLWLGTLIEASCCDHISGVVCLTQREKTREGQLKVQNLTPEQGFLVPQYPVLSYVSSLLSI